MPNDYRELLRSLARHRAEVIVVGGMAAVSHGSALVTVDLDLCYRRQPENYAALASALETFAPRLRGVPPDLPFRWDARTIGAGLNFTLRTDVGDVDLLGELLGGMTYEHLLAHVSRGMLFGFPVMYMGLDDLIRSKEATGRPKDRLHLEELRELRRRAEP